LVHLSLCHSHENGNLSFSVIAMMKNKIEAFLERKEIRDVFYVEFFTGKGGGISHLVRLFIN